MVIGRKEMFYLTIHSNGWSKQWSSCYKELQKLWHYSCRVLATTSASCYCQGITEVVTFSCRDLATTSASCYCQQQVLVLATTS